MFQSNTQTQLHSASPESSESCLFHSKKRVLDLIHHLSQPEPGVPLLEGVGAVEELEVEAQYCDQFDEIAAKLQNRHVLRFPLKNYHRNTNVVNLVFLGLRV